MKKILFVDDDKDILDVVDLFLKSHGYNVKTVLNGEEAIKQVAAFKPDVIFLDVKLGGVDGRDICQELKSDGKLNHIPIILFSAITGLKRTYKNCNADDLLPKPFDVFELIEKIKKHAK
jgi:DNA-binding response OmpR family regulator